MTGDCCIFKLFQIISNYFKLFFRRSVDGKHWMRFQSKTPFSNFSSAVWTGPITSQEQQCETDVLKTLKTQRKTLKTQRKTLKTQRKTLKTQRKTQNTLLIVHGDKPFVLISRVSFFSLVAPSIIKQKFFGRRRFLQKIKHFFFSNSVNEQYLIVREVSLV